MKAMGHTDIKTTMIYVSLGKSHIPTDLDSSDAGRENPTRFSLNKTWRFADNTY